MEMALLSLEQNFLVATYIETKNRKAVHGFEGLAQYDHNNDGVINHLDPIFDRLLLWHDKNMNGKVDPGELSSLIDNDVTGIYLGYTWADDPKKLVNGSFATVPLYSYFEMVDGSKHLIGDIYFHPISIPLAGITNESIFNEKGAQ